MVLRQPRQSRRRKLDDELSATPIKRSVESATRGSSRPRVLFDPLLLLATLGLVVISVIAIDGSTRNDFAGAPKLCAAT